MEKLKEIFNAIIIEKLAVDESQIQPNARFTDDLGADSLDMVELVMEFEKAFKIYIPDDIAEKIAKVSEAENYILENIK